MHQLKLFFRKILKAQFLWKHIFIFIILPVIASFFLAYLNITTSDIEKIIPNLVTIIWVTGSLLLNFLVIVLTSNSTILSDIKNKKSWDYSYWKINKGTEKVPEMETIDLYYFIYYKTFFLIFFSIFFILIYIFSFLWLYIFIWFLDKCILYIVNYFSINIAYIDVLLNYWIIKYLAIWTYLYFIILYFLLFLHLIYNLYYLFHETDAKN
jgi:hypothetical protein